MKTIIAILIAIIFCSCSLTKNITKNKSKESSEIKTETATTRTITEVATQTIEVSADTLKSNKNVDLILNGDSIYEDTPEQTITVKIVKGKLQAKAIKKKQVIPVNINRTIIEKELKKEDSKISKEITTKDKHVERTGINLNYLWWLLLLLIIPIWRLLK